MREPTVLECASSNPGKLREFQRAADRLGSAHLVIRMLPALADIPAPEETGTTFEANAILKAEYYSRHTADLLFADDSGLEVASLGGAPGVHSARFAGPSSSAADNNRLLLERLGTRAERRARFVCSIALALARNVLGTFVGEVSGTILRAPRGSGGFGYDPLFLPDGDQRSFAEFD